LGDASQRRQPERVAGFRWRSRRDAGAFRPVVPACDDPDRRTAVQVSPRRADTYRR